jgi:isopenicillin-N epimerase
VRPYGPNSPWHLDPEVVFLNHGSFGACPVQVLEAQRALVDELEAGPVEFLWTTFEPRLDAARRDVAAFLGADPEGLVFVPNATTGVSTVLRSLRFEPGDELLTTNHEYNAVLNALAEVARPAGAKVVVVRLPVEIESDEQVLEALIAAVTPRTRLALVSHVTSPTATIFPVGAIVAALDGLGIDTLVDGAHAPGMVPLDLDSLGAAYWTGNGHKWLCGPKGSGVLHVRADRRDRIRPLVISHGFNDRRPNRPRLWKEFDWVGTPDPTPYLALPAAIRTMATLHPDGWPGVMSANHDLALLGRSKIAARIGSGPRIPEAMIGSMAIVLLPVTGSDDEIMALKTVVTAEDRFEPAIFPWPVPAAREHEGAPAEAVAVRISAQLYNEPADYDHFADALARRLP